MIQRTAQKIQTYADGKAWFADKQRWHTIAKRRISQPSLEYLQTILDEDLASGYPVKLSVGTDSQQWRGIMTFATAIIVHKEGRGSRGLYTKWTTPEMGLFHKLLHETQSSLYCAWGMSELVEAYQIPLEIHLDINPKEDQKSHIAMKECLGYVLGMGYIGILKPDATTTRAADYLLKSGSWGHRMHEN